MDLELESLPIISKKGLALDIDETLSFTVRYWVEELSKKFGSPNLSHEEIIKKYRYAENVPEWQNEEALNWMEEKRTSNNFQKELPLMEGAIEFVKKIQEIIPVVAYITARPEEVIEGTEYWLDKHGFPKAPIICKPSNISFQKSGEWKAKVLELLQDNVLGIVEDNKGFLEFLPLTYKGTVFLYDNKKVDSKFSDLNVIACPTWKDVYEEVKKRFI